jgi:hypothetical protein
MSDNLDLWNAVADIDPEHTKPITGKDYKGTSPNPQYMIMLATEHLGPVGKGFGWNIIDDGINAFGETYIHFCRIRFWWRDGDEIREYENYGQTKMAYKTQSGYIKVDEDAPKKSMTDAIIKCLSHLGFAANIFLGRWDDSGYVNEVRKEFERKNDPDREEREAKEAALAEAEKAEALASAETFTANFEAKIKPLTDTPEAGALIQKCQNSIKQLQDGYPDLFKRIEIAAANAGAPMRRAA